ncbi:hypothetical protein [Micromonospora sp. NPDC049891]|uniref:hypothetical protein n=1 Tax=Micromonospora sp. NPDC049891 TaxID=3155655 RepID=UPI0033D3EC39
MEVTPELVLDRVRAAGGRLKLEGLDEESLIAWRHAAKVAKLRLLRAGPQRLRSWSSPGGMSLLLVEVDRQGVESPALTPPDQPTRQWVPPPRPRPRTQEFLGRIVPVPSTVRRPHPIVQDLTEALDFPERMIYQHRPYLMPNKRRPVQRMRQIWQAVITEAEFRGYETLFRHNRRDHYDSGQLILRIGRDEFPLQLYGERGKPLQLTIKEVHPARRRGYDTWTDTADQPLHRQLGAIFTHIERWADLLIARREAEERREQERRRERQRREDEAQRQFTEDHRRKTIQARIGERQFADDARAYAAALAAVADDLEPDRAQEVRAWATWILQHADHVDPRLSREGMPKTPRPERDDLRPYLPAGHWHY